MVDLVKQLRIFIASRVATVRKKFFSTVA